MATFPVQLFRTSPTNGWQEFKEHVRLEVNTVGLIFRVNRTHQLLVDAPRQYIEIIEEVKENEFFRIKSEGKSALAFKLLDTKLAKALIEHFRRWSYKLSPVSERVPINSRPAFPNLKDKNVRDFILKLLFSEEFHDFVSEMEELLETWSTKIRLET
jgi:hypothetical protein